MRIISANISGSLILNGTDITTTVVSASIWSGSFSTRVTNLESFSSSLDDTYATDAQLNSYTSSINSYTGSLNTFTGSASSRLAALEVTTGSLNTASGSAITRLGNLETTTGSLNTASGSAITRLNALESTTGSLNTASGSAITRLNALETTTGSLNTASGSAITRLNALETTTGSLNTASGSAITRLNTLESVTGSYATTSSNNFVGTQYISNTVNPTGFTTTSSLYTDGGLRVTKDAYISGTLYLNNVTVYGTQSVNYITSSQLDISDNIISVNTATPSVRFGGLAVYDSGSTSLTGSILWDSQNNNWIYSNPSGSGNYDSSMVIMGPRNASTLGNEQGLNCNYLVLGHGSHHTTSSMIFHDGSTTCFPNAIVGGSTACITGTATIGGCVNVLTGNQIRLYNSAKNNWVQIESPLVSGDAAIDFKLTTQSGVVYMNNTGITCFNNTVCTPTLVVDKSNPVLYINAGNNETSTIGFTQGAVVGYGGFIKVSTGLGDRAMTFGLSAAGTNNDATEVVRIDDSGVTCFSSNVCVGGGLVVQQASTFGNTVGLFGSSAQLYIGGSPGVSDYTIFGWCSTNKSLNIRNQSVGNSGQLVITCEGNVVIGDQTALGSKLTIVSANDQAGITMYNTYDCNKWSLRTGTTGINNKGFGIVDDICNATRIQIDGAGNVGIGTLSPGGRLDVVTCSNTTQNFYLRNTNNLDASSRSYFNIVAGNTSLSLLALAGGGSCGGTYIAGTTGADMYFQQSQGGTVNMVIKAGGEVGIGVTPSAGNKFWVKGSSTSASDTSLYIQNSACTSMLTVKNSNTTHIGTLTGGGETLNVSTTMAVRANLTGTEQNIFHVGNTGSGVNDGYMRLLRDGVAKVLIAADNSRGGDTYFNGGGNFGIGTNAPTSKLFVLGNGSYNSTISETLTSDTTIFSSEMTNDAYNSILQLVSVRQSLSTGQGSNGFLGFSTIDDSNGQGIRDAGRIAIVNETGVARNSPTSLSFWTNSTGINTGAATEKMRIYSNGASKFAMNGVNTAILQRQVSVPPSSCVNICFDMSTDIPGKGAGWVFQADIYVSGYGSAGSSGLVYRSSVGGYDGHYIGVGSYHQSSVQVKCASGVDIAFYNPSGSPNLLGVTIYNCSGAYTHVGTMRMVLTY